MILSTMRGLIAAALARDPEIEVVGEAADPLAGAPGDQGAQSRRRHARRRDAEHERPRVSREDHAAAADAGDHGLDADEPRRRRDDRGARDRRGRLHRKAETGQRAQLRELPFKVKIAAISPRAAARARDDGRNGAPEASRRPASTMHPTAGVVAIGASTGGVEALIALLSHFPANCPPTVITQHMPASFTRSFASRLDRVCAPRCRKRREARSLQPGHIYLAPGGTQHLEVAGTGPCVAV